MSDFSALNTAVTGLHAHRKRMDVIGENIANLETPGYHRQTAQLSPIDTHHPGFFSGPSGRHAGVTADVHRRWDELLDNNAKRELGRSASLETQAAALASLEAELGPVGEGLAARLQELWNSFDDVANNPEHPGVRNVVLGNAEAVASSLNGQAQLLLSRRSSMVEQFETRVGQVNNLSLRIAELDQTVVASAAAGNPANGALDERDRLATELSSLVGGQVSYDDHGRIRISLDGHNLVSEGTAGAIEATMTPDAALADLGHDRLAVTTTGGRELRLTGGSVHGGLQALNDLLITEERALNEVAAATVNVVNGLHQSGTGLDGGTGYSLFDPAGVTADSVAVSADVVGQPDRLAASNGSTLLDNTVARALADLGEDPNGPSAVHANAVANLGSRVDTLNGRADAATLASDHAESTRQSAVGVSLDEELADLVSAQRAYEASSRMISAVDQMLDVLINRTGIVGR